MAAGSQPITVSCKMRHEIEGMNFPLNRNESQGKTMANAIIGSDLMLRKIIFSDFPVLENEVNKWNHLDELTP